MISKGAMGSKEGLFSPDDILEEEDEEMAEDLGTKNNDRGAGAADVDGSTAVVNGSVAGTPKFGLSLLHFPPFLCLHV